MLKKSGYIRSKIRSIKNGLKVHKHLKRKSNRVYDYNTWESYGGMQKPLPSGDKRPCYIWFVPDWVNVWGGGHYTLFRFANYFAQKGTRQIIYVYDKDGRSSPDALQKQLDDALKDCRLEVVVAADKLPACDVVLATTWQSAYFVWAFPFAKSKFYFMQDYESHFYAHGTASMQANDTYTFGFKGITGGTWNRKHFEQYGGTAEHYIFSTDREIFYPSNKDGDIRDKVSKIFFYGRPSTERRCFELGIASLALIAEKYPQIEIVIAGLDLDTSLPFKATMLGNLSLAATGELYRTCDLGIAFSATNLSYLPVELMACGVPIISNKGSQVEWYCQNMVNSMLVNPTPLSVLKGLDALVADKKLRQSLVKNGLAKSAEVTWESEMDRIFQYVESTRQTEPTLEIATA